MVLVDPLSQRQGIGMRLLREALYVLRREKTVKLDATPAGRQVYLKLGFIDEYHLSRMQVATVTAPLKTTMARPMEKKDLPSVIAFDSNIFGASRGTLLEWMREGAPQYAFLVEERNEIRGYCLGRQGYNFTHIGPVIAKDLDIAQDLVSAALGNCSGYPVILDIPHMNPQWLAWLTSLGFTEQRPFIRMYRGSNHFTCQPEKQFAITGPEFG